METHPERTENGKKTNLLQCLFDRENNFNRLTTLKHISKKTLHIRQELEMFKCFPPNFTILNADMPYGIIHKFTPNGQFLLFFTHDKLTLEIYKFRSVGAMADLLVGQTAECIGTDDRSKHALFLREETFKRMFVLRRSILPNCGIPDAHFNTEFSLFIKNGRFVIVASMGIVQNMRDFYNGLIYPDFYHVYVYFFYNFYLIDLTYFFISDCVTYKCDSIELSNNQGVSCYDNKIAILSEHRQCIDLYEVKDGCLNMLYEIGVYGAKMPEPFRIPEPINNYQNGLILPLSHFKQRLLAFLYRRILKERNITKRCVELYYFYEKFTIYEEMVITKIQLYDKDTIIIRYEQHPQYNYYERDEYYLQLYVFYKIESGQILEVIDDKSKKLVHCLRDNYDIFQNSRSYQTGRRPTSSSNSIYLLEHFNKILSSVNDSTRLMNQQLPMTSQIYSTSPYLDFSLFAYNTQHISAAEVPRLYVTQNVDFRDRITQHCLFRLNLVSNIRDYEFEIDDDEDDETPEIPNHNLVEFIFHPYEPFIISIQKLANSLNYVINFHIYNKWTNVSQ